MFISEKNNSEFNLKLSNKAAISVVESLYG